MPNKIKYPIAFNKRLERLFNIGDVDKSIKDDFICNDCNENFVSVLNHKTPHFRHKINSNCKGNVETYIHWLTKELFKEIKEIEFPEIFKTNLSVIQQEKLDKGVKKILDDNNFPKELRIKFLNGLKTNLTESKKLIIDKCEIEKTIKVDDSHFIVDVAVKINKGFVFIEPFFSNPISKEKAIKIIKANKPTLSIDLQSFIYHNNYNYTKEELIDYLTSKQSKLWEYNRDSQIEEHIIKYFAYVKEELQKKGKEVESIKIKKKRLNNLEKEIDLLNKKIEPTILKIDRLREELDEIKKELGISTYSLD